MPRKRIIFSDVHPYHVSARANNREMFSVPLELLWPIFIEIFELVKLKYSCHLHVFVLMGNHYHLIISTPLANIDEIMEYLNREVAKRANKLSKRINHFFGGPYEWTLISDEAYYWNAVKYDFRNPVKAGLCLKVEDYRYSSLNRPIEKDFWLLNKELLGDKKPKYLSWFNHDFKEDQQAAIKKGFRRREFKLPKDKNSKTIKLDAPQL